MFMIEVSKKVEPKSYQHASKEKCWVEAMNEEMAALHECQTWQIVPRPDDKNVVGSKWVYKLKYKPDGSIDRHKARLVARGFTQQYGEDYDETFSPVIKMGTIRVIISLAVSYGWSLYQLDVKNVFLHGIFKEEVYMEQPPGYTTHDPHKWVCKLHKSLYGLKQASRSWFDRFSHHIQQVGFLRSSLDHSLFIYHTGEATTWLLIYIDDIVITGNSSSHISYVKGMLQQEFKMKDLGELRYFLGVELDRTNDRLTLTQHKYTLDILYRAGIINCKPITTPSVLNTKLAASDGTAAYSNPTFYRSIVGMLQYLTFTRPDIVYAVNQISQFMHAPTEGHMDAAKRILRYLKATLGDGLVYTKCPNVSLGHSIYTYIDADWAGDPDDRRFVSGFCFFLDFNLICWSSKKQRAVARSSTEAEYRAMAAGTAEASWLRHLLGELNLPIVQSSLLCDNQSAIKIAYNPILHNRTKHIEIDQHFIRQKVEEAEILPTYISTSEQIADLFTKGLTGQHFWDLKNKLCMIKSHAQLEGGC
uniref:Reverse transcriptase Ty1/copia-type domain-containing protein n=1 Tax=Nymphaea colorata TaxID=210225 RepID=A0A5K1A4K1_9MAGN